MTAPSILLVAGEASGDLHGARLLAALRQRRPELTAFGLGGEELRSAGLEAVSDDDIAVVGIAEVLKVLPRARKVFRTVLDEAERRRPSAAVLIDFPEFNLRLAAKLQELGIPVIYYISPQVWAWRRRRVKKIARIVDLMLVLFPFEAAFYEKHDVEVRHVGHPLVDEVPAFPQRWDRPDAEEGPFRIALMPGSRPSEVDALLPGMLEAVKILARELPVLPQLVRARSLPAGLVEGHLEAAGFGGRLGEGPEVEVVTSDRFKALADSHLVLCASGTATLETGLLGVPLLVVYRLSFWSYHLARILVRLPYFSLVNLVLEEKVVPELLQREADPPRVAAAAASLLRDRAAVDAMRRRLGELRQKLGEGGASERAAEAVLDWLDEAAQRSQR